MTLGKASRLVVGIIGVFGLGMLAGPHIIGTGRWNGAWHDDAPAAESRPATVTSETPTPMAARRPAASAIPAVAPTSPALQQQLKPVLAQGTDMNKAAAGFKNAEQFATLAYASRNTAVPFVVLKHRVLNEGKSLTAAIRESHPAMSAAAAVERARAQARLTLLSLRS